MIEASASAALEQLETLHARGVFSALDLELGRLFMRLAPEDSPWVALSGALVNRATQAGHVCLPLDSVHQQRIVDVDERAVNLEIPPLAQWRECLERSPLVSDGSKLRPLVLTHDRLYLHRYHSYECRLVKALTRRLRNNEIPLRRSAEEALEVLFSGAPPDDLQRRAARLACTHRLSVISGGPGTGKTTTVAKVLVAVLQQLEEQGQDARLSVLAPTGKAATRLGESLAAGFERLSLTEQAREVLSVAPSTIHRALGYQPRSPARFRHNSDNPLPSNVVVVDEASMVDLALMTKLVEAVREDAHLILLGDRDQLASVETGAVFGDLFDDQPSRTTSAGNTTLNVRPYSTEVDAGLLDATPAAATPAIAQCSIHLEKSYRYASQGGIARLAAAIRAGDVAEALSATALDGVEWVELSEAGVSTTDCAAELEPLLVRGYRNLCEASTPVERLDALSQYRVLSPHRRGQLGVAGLNRLCERVLLGQGLQARASGAYAGQPIIIANNDYQAELYNGDVGVLDRTAAGKMAAFFPRGTALRQLSLARLPSYDTVFAMTIHKSQGSEFDRVLVVLPHHGSPLLSRELLYTAITRAKSHVTLACTRESFETAVRRRLHRASGLHDALWGGL